jgi:HEAT repeat protein
MLGPDACPAVPDLIKIVGEPIDSTRVGAGNEHPIDPTFWDPAWAAADALQKNAPGTPSAGEVIQALTEVLQTGRRYRRAYAAYFLGEFGPAAVAAVPALINVLSENTATKSSFADGSDAAVALGKIAPGTPLADKAITSLADALQAESQFTRTHAIEALLQFGPRAAVSILRLRALTNDPHTSVRLAATKAIAALEAAECGCIGSA